MLLRSRRVGQQEAPRAGGPAEGVDRITARFNIEHFSRLLGDEVDDAKRRLLRRLLAEEEAKLDVLDGLPLTPPEKAV